MDITLTRVFGEKEEEFMTMLDHICEGLKGIKFAFLNTEALEEVYKKDYQLGEQLYWYNVLQNCHFISCASLLRTKRWMDGIRYGLKEGNYIIFASSLRGLIESTADSMEVMQVLPKTLELNFVHIYKALKGDLKTKDG